MEFTEFEFTLPKGLMDMQGGIHRHGVMRLATGKDEMAVYKHPGVKQDPAYKILVILSRLITRLGNLSSLTPQLLEQLFLIDLIYLQEFLNRIHQDKGGLLTAGEF